MADHVCRFIDLAGQKCCTCGAWKPPTRPVPNPTPERIEPPEQEDMKLINCSKYSDGQGAFKNGMHDCIAGVKFKDNLYKLFDCLPWQRVNRFAWRCGWLFQRATGLGYCENGNAIRMARKSKDVLKDLVTAIRCADEENFRRAWDDARTYLHQPDAAPCLVDGLLSSREFSRQRDEQAKLIAELRAVIGSPVPMGDLQAMQAEIDRLQARIDATNQVLADNAGEATPTMENMLCSALNGGHVLTPEQHAHIGAGGGDDY